MRKPLLFMALLFAVPLFAQSPGPETTAAIDSLFKTWQQPGHPGGVVGILQDGKLVLSRAYGLASLEYEVPIDTATVFNVGSVSKQFTAFSIVLLAQQGKLSLDDDIRKHLPELPDFGSVITLRHCLNHTSGMRNFQNLLAMAGWREGDAMTNADLLRYMSQQKELNFPTGSEFLYCNTGYNLMTEVVHRVTGETFIKWTKANIFEPLGMHHTEYRDDLGKIYHKTATSYNKQPSGGFERPGEYWTYTGNGNVYTTLSDLAKWTDNFRTHLLGGAAAIDMLTQRALLNNGDTLDYALGIYNDHYKGLQRRQHGGAVGGYRASLQYFPDQRCGILVLTNFSSSDPGTKSNQVADIWLKPYLKPKPAQETEHQAIVAPSGAPPGLEEISGVYYSPELHTSYTFRAVDNRVVVSHARHLEFPMFPAPGDLLRSFSPIFTEVKIERDAAGIVTGFLASNGRVRNLWFEKRE